MNTTWVGEDPPQLAWPRIESAQVIEDGQALGIFVREFDGTISAVRITVQELAD